MSHYKTFRIIKQNKDAKPSFLIMVIDGTGSMRDEYNLMIDAYKTVFYDKIQSNEVHAIQFGSNNQLGYQISSIEPFLGGGGGNFNLAFENVLEKLEEDIEADITICVVSDGREPCNIKELKQKVVAAKKKYQIQFTSIAVGSTYPFELFQVFRDCFHNGAVSCTNVQVVERVKVTGIDECSKSFIKAFEIVRSLLTQQKIVELNQLVCDSIGGKLSYIAIEDTVVASLEEIITTKEGLEIKETRKAPDIAEFIQTSCQEFIKTQSNEKFQFVTEQAKEVKQIAQDLLSRVDLSSYQNRDNVKKVIQQMERDIFILEEISIGKCDLKNLSDEEKTKILSDFNPKKVEIQEAIAEEKVSTQDELEISETKSSLELIQNDRIIQELQSESDSPEKMMNQNIKQNDEVQKFQVTQQRQENFQQKLLGKLNEKYGQFKFLLLKMQSLKLKDFKLQFD